MKSLFLLAITVSATLFSTSARAGFELRREFYEPVEYRLVKGAGCPAVVAPYAQDIYTFGIQGLQIRGRLASSSMADVSFMPNSYFAMMGHKQKPLDGISVMNGRFLQDQTCDQTNFRCGPNERVTTEQISLISFSRDYKKLMVDRIVISHVRGFFKNEKMAESNQRCSYVRR